MQDSLITIAYFAASALFILTLGRIIEAKGMTKK
jgi:hypothetical protein